MTWDYDKNEYGKQAKADKQWYLERLINYGLRNEKFDRVLLEQYLPKLNIPNDKRTFLELLIWNKKF